MTLQIYLEVLRSVLNGQRSGAAAIDELALLVAKESNFDDALTALFSDCDSGELSYDEGYRVFALGEYQIYIYFNSEFSRIRKALQLANSLEIVACPILLSARQLSDGAGVVVTQIPGADGSLRKFSDEPVRLSAEVQSRLALDFEMLLSAGVTHPFAAYGDAHWFLHPQTGHVMFNAWQELCPLQSEQLDEARAHIARIESMFD